jgi:hypothetical protein
MCADVQTRYLELNCWFLLEYCVLHRAVSVLLVVGIFRVLKHRIFGHGVSLPSFDFRSCLAAEHQSQFPNWRTPGPQVFGSPQQTARYLPFANASNLAERPVCRDVFEEETHFRWYIAVGVCMRKTSTLHIRQKKDRGEPYTREDFIRSEHIAFGVSILMNCRCLISISSYIDALFSCKKNSNCLERVKTDGNSNFCSDMYPHCTGASNAQKWISIVLWKAILNIDSL